jgi:glycosyltransferase involved in cell wall biosynthesis
MIVYQFSTYPHGGAGTAANRLHRQLRVDGVDSRFFYWECDSATENRNSYEKAEFFSPRRNVLLAPVANRLKRLRQKKIYSQYDAHLRGRPEGFELFSMARQVDDTAFDFRSSGCDIVHLHWLAHMIDYPTFFSSIPDSTPIVWTLHDMNPFTGGCHYSSGCSRFTVGCGHCSQIKDASAKDVSFDSFQIKKQALKNKNLHVVTPSIWLGELAKASSIFPKQTTFQVIDYGFDLEQYRPLEKSFARKQLGVSSDATLILFGAEDISNHRKGFQHLVGALKKLNTQNKVECLVFGKGELPNDDASLPKMHSLGFIDSADKQRVIYSAADLFVMPSREDNQPQTALEAMACGTPVVAFRAGGVPEYVIPNETGALAAVGDDTELARRIAWMVDQPARRKEMGMRARQLCEIRFDSSRQSNAYQKLYFRLLGLKSRKAA